MEVDDWNIVSNILTSMVGIIGLLLAFWFNKRSLEEKQIEERRRDTYKKLNELYGPCLLNLRISRELYALLTANQEGGFSALRFFLRGDSFSGNDAELYSQINRITNEVDKLITQNTGLVDKPNLQKSLAVATAHFRIIDAAYRGRIQGDLERFSDYSYPAELIQELETEVQQLQSELNRLSGKNPENKHLLTDRRLLVTDPALRTPKDL